MRGWICLALLFAASCNCGHEISGKELPFCTPSGPCDAPLFDADAGKCAHAVASDGTACDAGLVCQTSTHCTGGACVGTPVTCDDADACTVDTCLEGHGCQHTAVTCDGDNPCYAYGCDAILGCSGTGQPVADGTACLLWWEPCVDDATCTSGACDSPTADAETPGQVRWQVPLSNPIGPFTVDDAGTSTYLVSSDGGPYEVVSIDACGSVRWTAQTGLGFVTLMQGSSQLLVAGVASDNAAGSAAFNVALDPASGVQQWSANLSALLDQQGLDGGCDSVGPVWAAASNDGSIYTVIGECSGSESAGALVAVDPSGRLEWFRQSPFGVGSPPALASNGNILVGGVPLSGCVNNEPKLVLLWAVSPQGETLQQEPLNLPVPDCEPLLDLSVGSEGIAVENLASVFAFDGGFAGQFSWVVSAPDGGTIGPFAVFYCAVEINPAAPIVDAAGNLFVAGILPDSGYAGTISFSPNGQERWRSSEISDGNLLLSDDGVLIGLQEIRSAGVAALDANNGSLQWSVALTPASPYGWPYLALTPGASLLTVSGGSATAIFAGRHRPSMTAPWSRWGGDNSNRNCAR